MSNGIPTLRPDRIRCDAMKPVGVRDATMSGSCTSSGHLHARNGQTGQVYPLIDAPILDVPVFAHVPVATCWKVRKPTRPRRDIRNNTVSAATPAVGLFRHRYECMCHSIAYDATPILGCVGLEAVLWTVNPRQVVGITHTLMGDSLWKVRYTRIRDQESRAFAQSFSEFCRLGSSSP